MLGIVVNIQFYNSLLGLLRQISNLRVTNNGSSQPVLIRCTRKAPSQNITGFIRWQHCSDYKPSVLRF